MKNKKLAIGLGVLSIVLIGGLIALGIQVNFLTKDELHIELEPRQLILNTQNNGSVELNFTVGTNNFWFCDSVCTFELTDLKDNTLLSSQRENMTQTIRKVYSLSFNNSGRGQNLFKFEAKCNNIVSFLCRTDQKQFTRNALVTVNYDLTDNEKELEEKFKQTLSDDEADIVFYSDYIDYLDSVLSDYEIKADLSSTYDFLDQIQTKHQNHLSLFRSNEYYDLESNYQYHRFDILNNDINYNLKILKQKIESNNFLVKQLNQIKINQSIYQTLVKFNDLNYFNFQANVKKYNDFVNNFNKADLNSIEELEQKFLNSKLNFQFDVSKYKNASNIDIHLNRFNLSLSNYSNNYCEAIPDLIDLYNSTYKFDNETNSSVLVYNQSDYAQLITLNKTCIDVPELDVNSVTKEELEMPSAFDGTKSTITINSNPKQCCIYNNCSECKIAKTPVILLHGHSFDKSSPIESSLNAFIPMQKMLEQNGYINAGDLDLSSTVQSGLWSEFENPIAIRVSYYELFYYDADQFTASLRKSESIENYAIRLRELIEIVKEKTGSDKVNIIAHSMGGLVARNYINLFGRSDIENLITIGTPHFGIEGQVATYCDTFGAEKECEDMMSDSLFLKRLNQRFNFENIYVIYGTGCEGGDGIVLEKNAKYDPYDNFKVTGSCEEDLFHNSILESEEVYEIVKSILQ